MIVTLGKPSAAMFGTMLPMATTVPSSWPRTAQEAKEWVQAANAAAASDRERRSTELRELFAEQDRQLRELRAATDRRHVPRGPSARRPGIVAYAGPADLTSVYAKLNAPAAAPPRRAVAGAAR
jgi:hypothetical protein